MADLTDLEATRLCAQAMRIAVNLRPIRGTIMRYWFMDGNVEREYDPLHDRAQWAELVERLELSITYNPQGSPYWTVNSWGGNSKWSEAMDLPSAIVHCAASIQLSRESGGKKP